MNITWNLEKNKFYVEFCIWFLRFVCVMFSFSSALQIWFALFSKFKTDQVARTSILCLWHLFLFLKPWKTLVISPKVLFTLSSCFAFHCTIICMGWWTKEMRFNWLPPSVGHFVVYYDNSQIAILKLVSPFSRLHFRICVWKVDFFSFICWMKIQNCSLKTVDAGFKIVITIRHISLFVHLYTSN